jgi:hypothetical protein
MARPRKPPTADAALADSFAVTLTADELDLLCAALDSHIYWELSDESSRDSGYADSTCADDETAGEIAKAEALLRRFEEQCE